MSRSIARNLDASVLCLFGVHVCCVDYASGPVYPCPEGFL